MNQQPNKPEVDPTKKDGVLDPMRPRQTPGSAPNDPSKRNVSPGEKPERADKERQEDPKPKTPPDIQMRSY